MESPLHLIIYTNILKIQITIYHDFVICIEAGCNTM